jgi:hypothetical protein
VLTERDPCVPPRPAFDRVKEIKKGKRLKFPITVTDVNGEKTKIKAKAKAR